MWDWLGGQLPGLPTSILRGKVAKRVDYLEADDNLIWMFGGVEEMSFEEVKMACVERGIDVLERKEGDVRENLQAWLDSREKVPVEKLLLTRYVAFHPSSLFAKCGGKSLADVSQMRASWHGSASEFWYYCTRMMLKYQGISLDSMASLLGNQCGCSKHDHS